MLAASNADMKAYWCNEVFAKVYSLYCGLHMISWILCQNVFSVKYLFEFSGISDSCWLVLSLHVHVALFYGKRYEHEGQG